MLEGPVCAGMSGDIEVKDPPRTNLRDHKDAKDLKRGRHGDEVITGNNSQGMISHERRPTLGRDAVSIAATLGDIASDCPRRDSDSQLRQ
jgi:hypothetical protein